MKKYIDKDNGIYLFNEDAIKIMDVFIEGGKKFDCIVTDPPYKVTARGRGKNTTTGGMLTKEIVNKGKVFKHNDLEIEEWLPKLWNLLNDVSHCYIMTNQKNITKYLKTIDDMYFNNDKKQKFHFIKNLIWMKDNKIMGQTYMSQFEYIIMLRRGAHKRINNCGDSDILQFANKKMKDEDKKTIHDTEKPVGLLETIIKNATNKGDIVLDPFMEINSAGVACKNLGRKFVGIELDEDYFNKSVERISKI